MKLKIAFVLCALIAAVVCYDNTTIGDLPPGVAAQLLSMLTNKTITATGGCNETQESDIELILHTRNNANNTSPLNLTNPTEIDPSKKVILLTHGWVSNRFRFVPETTDAYLSQYDANVITVDWSKLASSLYTAAVCYVPKVADIVADFLCLLEQKFGVPVETVHLVGHSLGGQMSGFIGQKVKEKCGKCIGRITAMDPAGPLYQGVPTSERLDKSDAAFVDVIHTNGGVLGYWNSCGHADFHVNCGTIQLSCPEIGLSFEAIKNVPVSVVTCHHSRSVDYMTESISNANHFQATSCSSCPLPCVPNLFRSTQTDIVMGEHCPNSADGNYVLATNLISPFGGESSLKKLIPSISSFQNII